jgi:hypothetical protein
MGNMANGGPPTSGATGAAGSAVPAGPLASGAAGRTIE